MVKVVDFPRGRAPTSEGGRKYKKNKSKSPFIGNLIPDEVEDGIVADDFEVNGSGEASKRKRKGNKNALTTEENEILAGTREGHFQGEMLTYANICEGVLALGRVENVTDENITVSLPCRVAGEVSLLNLSQSYSKLMKNLAGGGSTTDPWYTLPEMFTTGRLVSVVVKQVEVKPTRKIVHLSMNPEDLHKNYSAENLKDQMLLTAAVESVEDHGYIMSVGIKNTRAFLSAENAKSFIKKVNYNRDLGIGQLVTCQIISAKLTNNVCNLQLTADPKTVHKFKYGDEMNLNYSLLLPGMQMNGIVMENRRGGLKLHVMDLEGFIHKHHLDDSWKSPKQFEVSETVRPRILYLFPSATNPYLSLQPNLYPHNLVKTNDGMCQFVTAGQNYQVKVVHIEKSGVIARLTIAETGLVGKVLVSILRCSDDASLTQEQIFAQFSKGSTHLCRIKKFNSMDNLFVGSFKKSDLNRVVTRIEQVEPGKVFKVYVQHWTPRGAVVTFQGCRGLIPAIHFGNIPVSNPEAKFPPGTTISAKVMKVNHEKKHIFLTAKKELVKNEIPILKTWDAVQTRMVSKGVVIATNKGGVVIETVGGLKAFAPIKFLGIGKEANIATLFFLGRIMSFQVLHAYPEKNQLVVSFIIQDPIELNGEEIPPRAENGNVSEPRSKKTKKKRRDQEILETEAAEPEKKKRKKNEGEVEGEQEDQIVEDEDPKKMEQQIISAGKKRGKRAKLGDPPQPEDNAEIAAKKLKKMKKNPLEKDVSVSTGKISKKHSIDVTAVNSLESETSNPFLDDKGHLKIPDSKFAWDETEVETIDADQSQEFGTIEVQNGSMSNQSTRKERRKLKEAKIRESELAQADASCLLKTEEDYERLVIASPNSSLCWIQYMAHFLQQGEVAKAKELGRRAIQTILYREEEERFNVWVALLNLENRHGTPESIKTVLAEAMRCNAEYKVLSTMGEIYHKSSKFEDAEEMYKKLTKKFRERPEAYLKYCRFLYVIKNLDEARSVFQRALHLLDRCHHVQLISQYSQLELELGERDRGRTLFDQLLANYPKRIDIWLVYANVLAKLDDYEGAKNVLIRAIEIGFPPKKCKPLFQRLFEIDKLCPNSDPDAIRQLAVEYASGLENVAT